MTYVNMSLEIGGTQLMRIGNDCTASATKFLGLTIDDSLNWKSHVSAINSKIARAIFAIKQVKHFLPYDSLRTIYYALIHPHLSYGILAWGNAKDSILKKTILLQKRALRYIHNSGYNSHTDPLFQHSGILKLRDLYEFQISYLCMIIVTTNFQTRSARYLNSIMRCNLYVQPDSLIWCIFRDVTRSFQANYPYITFLYTGISGVTSGLACNLVPVLKGTLKPDI